MDSDSNKVSTKQIRATVHALQEKRQRVGSSLLQGE